MPLMVYNIATFAADGPHCAVAFYSPMQRCLGGA